MKNNGRLVGRVDGRWQQARWKMSPHRRAGMARFVGLYCLWQMVLAGPHLFEVVVF